MTDIIDEKLTFRQPKVIWVEGKDDQNFILAILRHLGKINDYQVVSMKGKRSQRDNLKYIRKIRLV